MNTLTIDTAESSIDRLINIHLGIGDFCLGKKIANIIENPMKYLIGNVKNTVDKCLNCQRKNCKLHISSTMQPIFRRAYKKSLTDQLKLFFLG